MAGPAQDRTARLWSVLDEHFMAVAVLAARRSNDPHTKVGACIVNEEEKIVGIGYNDMPDGCEGLTWDKSTEARQLELSETKHAYVCHAELNAILNKNSTDVKGCTIYVSLFPCNECAKLIVQTGIKKVVYLSDREKEAFKASRKLLENAGIKLSKFQPDETKIVIDFNNPHTVAATAGDLQKGDRKE